MKRVALGLLLIALAAACGNGGKNLAGTHLRITALNAWVGMAVFKLDCPPAGVPVAADLTPMKAACNELAQDPSLVTSPKPFTCIGGPTSWFDVTISGRLAGKPVHQKFSTCWTPQMRTLDKLGLARELGSHIRRRREGHVPAGRTQTFPSGALRPGDLLICRIRGHRLKLGIPARTGSMGTMGWGGKNVVSVTLTGTRHADGSITASCHRGNP